MRHGTTTGYVRHGCRCRQCSKAQRDYQQKRKASAGVPELNTKIPHGTASTYTGYGCRCEPCREAQRLAIAKYRATRAANIKLIELRNQTAPTAP